MKCFLIDYQRPDGRRDFKVVEAATADRAVEIFRSAGVDGWTGVLFRDYTILAVMERGALIHDDP